VLGQIGGLYVVMETDEGFVLMDPHAAHERVLFDILLRRVREGQVSSQGLLLPETVEVAPRDAERLRRHLDAFRALGFGIAEFGGDAFVVDALPAGFPDGAARGILLDTVVALEQGGVRGATDAAVVQVVAQAACKAAVKARDHLNLEEIERLVVDLAQSEMPYTCPHGRPTMILTTYRELGRRFGRE
jgi:DNA mismatch repair protein MutL